VNVSCRYRLTGGVRMAQVADRGVLPDIEFEIAATRRQYERARDSGAHIISSLTSF